jgi:anti-anti-sigma factor
LTLFESLREVLLRTCVAAEAHQLQYLDQIMRANLEVSSSLLGSGVSQSTDLSWLRHMGATWGYLGLWSSDDMSSLSITASYSSTATHPNLTGRIFRTETFPPRQLMMDQGHGEDITILMPVRSPSKEWGILVLGGPHKPQIYSTASPTEIWAGMLGTELDRAQVLADLRHQQAHLQSAYERERALTSTIRELSCPTIPLLPGVLLLPLIGTIDADRAQLIIQAVLEEVSRSKATEVLIDVTGVPMIDSQVANILVQMSQMISLLGARSTLVGVRPEIAQSIVGLGADLSGIRTSPTLASVVARFVRSARL